MSEESQSIQSERLSEPGSGLSEFLRLTGLDSNPEIRSHFIGASQPSLEEFITSLKQGGEKEKRVMDAILDLLQKFSPSSPEEEKLSKEFLVFLTNNPEAIDKSLCER